MGWHLVYAAAAFALPPALLWLFLPTGVATIVVALAGVVALAIAAGRWYVREPQAHHDV